MRTSDWKKVKRSQSIHGCACPMNKAMEREDFLALAQKSCTMPKYLCPAVDLALRLMPAAKDDE